MGLEMRVNSSEILRVLSEVLNNKFKASFTVGGYITLGYRGTFAFGRDGQADVKFRKLQRILVHGKAALCREVHITVQLH